MRKKKEELKDVKIVIEKQITERFGNPKKKYYRIAIVIALAFLVVGFFFIFIANLNKAPEEQAPITFAEPTPAVNNPVPVNTNQQAADAAAANVSAALVNSMTGIITPTIFIIIVISLLVVFWNMFRGFGGTSGI